MSFEGWSAIASLFGPGDFLARCGAWGGCFPAGLFNTGWPQLQGDEVWSNPVLGDFDGDSELEIVASTIDGSTYVLSSDGSVVSGWPQPMCWTDWYSPVIGDITGDGVPDVITNNNHLDGLCAIYAWDFQGDLIDGFPKITGASLGGPVALADIDGEHDVARSNPGSVGPDRLDEGNLGIGVLALDPEERQIVGGALRDEASRIRLPRGQLHLDGPHLAGDVVVGGHDKPLGVEHIRGWRLEVRRDLSNPLTHYEQIGSREHSRVRAVCERPAA